jgi:hypothetical protein
MAAPPLQRFPVIDLNNTVGAIEIGVTISNVLFGLISCQGEFKIAASFTDL